jgi:Subtilase family
VVYRGRYRTFGLITSLLLPFGLAATVLAPGAEAATAYSPPSGSWARFQSDLNAAEGQATGSGVTIALLSTGADPTMPGLAGKVTNGPDYIFAPQVPEANMLGTALAAFLVGEPGTSIGVAPDARILVLRTEPDDSEPGAESFFENPPDEQQIDANAIRYAVGHGAQVILFDYESNDSPEPQLLSAVSYALSKNVVLVAPAGIAAEEPQTSQYVYPEGLPGVIGISQVMLPGGSPPQSVNLQNENNSVLISGPADDVPASASFDLENFGTAMGYVTGTVALIKQRFPNLSPALVARALAMSARYHPSGGYSTAYGFGVLDPNDAILDAGTLARLTPAATAGAPGVVAAGAHFGTPPGVISALPPVGAVGYLYWGLIAVGAALFVTGVVLLVRRRRSPARSRQDGAPPPVPTFSGHPSPGQPFSGQQYPGQPYPGQPYPGQPYPGQQYPGQPYPGAPQYPSQDQSPQPYQPLPFRQPAYPTRPNWSPLPPPSPTVPPPSASAASGPPPPALAPWEQPPSPAHAPWESAPPAPAHAPWEQAPPSPAPPSPGPPAPAAAPWEPAPPPPDPPESGKGWFDPR